VIVAAIPVRNNLKWTAPLVESLLLGDEVDEVWVYDNGSTDATPFWIRHRQQLGHRLKYIDASQMRFYEMWNHMIKTAADIGGVHLAILNNDIRLPHMAIKTMSDNMGAYTIATIDTEKPAIEPITEVHTQKIHDYRHRVGWAFMVKADFWKNVEYPIDPRFNLWYGDDYLYRRTLEMHGRVCRMVGVGCDHAVSASVEEFPDDKERAVKEDMELFYGMWP
jgi:GT2 family glycosyltransferase